MERIEIPFRLLNHTLVFQKLVKGALLCAGDLQHHNCMTIGWATIGVLWQRNVMIIYVRPTRYTYEFMNSSSDFTVSFIPPDMQIALDYCGTHSGREGDKLAACELTLAPSQCIVSPGIDQADLIFECVTLYRQDFDHNFFLDPSLEQMYPRKDYHRQYIGEIVRIEGSENFTSKPGPS